MKNNSVFHAFFVQNLLFLNYFIFLQSYAAQWKHIAFKSAFSEYQKAR